MPQWMIRLGQDLSSGLGLLTRIPVPRTAQPHRMSSSAWLWPLIGALLGLLAAISAMLLLLVALPPILCAILIVALLLSVTGALHEDGLADCADGLPNGNTAQERIRIMRDSRIGAFGTLALLLAVSLRIACLEALLATPHAMAALMIAGAVSRGAVVIVMGVMPPAAQDGLSSESGQPTATGCIIASGIALGTVLWLSGLSWLPALLATTTAVAGFCLYVRRQIGGQTGDVLGAVQVIAELTCLLSIVCLIQWPATR